MSSANEKLTDIIFHVVAEEADEAQREKEQTQHRSVVIASRPSDHYFRSVCLFVCLFVCAEFFSAVFDPISIKLGYMLYMSGSSCVP